MALLILASASPRRRELLSRLGLPFRVQTADVDEEQFVAEEPAEIALELAVRKAAVVAATAPPEALVIGADTVVALDGQLLGKPADAAAATRMLRALAGREHAVHTGMAVLTAQGTRRATAVSSSVVVMRPYSDAEIAAYVATGDPFDKAGAYAIQHPVFRPVAALQGSYTGVMGLDLALLADLLRALEVQAPEGEW